MDIRCNMNVGNNQTTTTNNTASILDNKSIVYEYFRLIKNKDINGLLSLFTDDAIVNEPFSNISGGIQGKSAIKSFLEVALLANSGLTHSIAIEKPLCSNNNINDKITALVTFQRGDSIRARFTFELVPVLIQSNDNNIHLKKKIHRLTINFI